MENSVKAGIKNISNSMGDWWKDDRRKWCAYCGIPMKIRCVAGTAVPMNKLTRDHILPRKLKFTESGLTIPACRSCNQAKGALSLPEFMAGEYFSKIRKCKHRNKWPLDELWKVLGLAAFIQSIESRS